MIQKKRLLFCSRLLLPAITGLCLYPLSSTAGPKQKASGEIAPAKAADEHFDRKKETSRFQSFLMPQMVLQDVTVEQALELFTQKYQETAAQTGDTATALHFDFSSANTTARFNLITPLAPADSVLRLLAGMAGNKISGPLSGFKLTALDTAPRPEAKGSLPVAPDIVAKTRSLLGIVHLPDEPATMDGVAKGLGIGGDHAQISLVGSKLSYSGLSEADEARLSLVTSDFIPPVQVKMEVSLAHVPGPLADLPFDPAFAPQDYAKGLRKLAKLQGSGELETMQPATGLIGEIIQQQDLVESPVPDAGTGLATIVETGNRCVTTCKPLGRAHQVSMRFESMDKGKVTLSMKKDVVIPDQGSGLVSVPLRGGKVLVIVLHPVLIDATGRPVLFASR